MPLATPAPAGSTRARTAIIIGRGGEHGAAQTVASLQSVVGAWKDVPVWDVRLLAPRDPALERVVRAMEGAFSVSWDRIDVDAVRAEVHAEGREPSIIVAGDACPPETPRRGAVVPLVDKQGLHPMTGEWISSLSNFHPDQDGRGLLTWQRDADPTVKHPVVVFTNLSLDQVINHRAATKVAWMIESPEVYGASVDFLLANANLFDLVITSDSALAQALPRAVVIPLAGCWVPPADQHVAVKSRDCSMVASGKGFTSGHRLRHEIIPTLTGVDLYGRGLTVPGALGPVANKADALIPYRYSIAVENTKTDTFFSEKLIDCFRTGTIPIWWGTDRIADHFNMNGVLSFNTVDELHVVLDRATPEHYQANLDAVQENFERAAAWRVVEDRIHPVLLPYL